MNEQHRFVFSSAKKLMDKAASHGHAPHVLVLTATPHSAHALVDALWRPDVSVLDELPPGRTPISTR